MNKVRILMLFVLATAIYSQVPTAINAGYPELSKLSNSEGFICFCPSEVSLYGRRYTLEIDACQEKSSPCPGPSGCFYVLNMGGGDHNDDSPPPDLDDDNDIHPRSFWENCSLD